MEPNVWGVSLAVVGVIATVAGTLAYSQKTTVKVLAGQIEARTNENKEDRDLYTETLSKVATSIHENSEATRALAGLIQEERKINARRHKEICECLGRMVEEDGNHNKGS